MGDSIDDLVFRPLESRFLETPFDQQGIIDYIALHGLPPSLRDSGDESIFKGFVFELNMRLSIERALHGVLYQLPEHALRNNDAIFRTHYGAVVIFRDGNDENAIEFDDLRELRVDGKVIPVIFEAKSGRGGNIGYARRTSCVRRVFDEDPYFCVVRPKKLRGPEGLFIDPVITHHRTLAIPTNGEVLEMAHYLMKNR